MKNLFGKKLILGWLLLALTIVVGLWLGGTPESVRSQKKAAAPVTAMENTSAEPDRNADPSPPAATVAAPKISAQKVPEAVYEPASPELGVSALQQQLQRAVEISRAEAVISEDLSFWETSATNPGTVAGYVTVNALVNRSFLRIHLTIP